MRCRNESLFKEPNHASRTPSVMCQPSAHFGRRLPIWSASAGDYRTSVGNHRLDVPLEFRPRKMNDRLANHRYASRLQAGRRGKTRRSPRNYVGHCDHDLRGSRFCRHCFGVRTEPFDVKSVEPEFSLEKNRCVSSQYSKRARPSASPSFHALFSQGSQRTTNQGLWNVVRAATRHPIMGRCRYTLFSRDLAFTLFIPDPSQWQTIDKNLLELMAWFERR